MNEPEIIELNNKNEEYSDFDGEIDPFASEKSDTSSSDNDNMSSDDNIETISEKNSENMSSDDNIHNSTETSTISNNYILCKVLVPMVSLNEILVEISVPFTISELFEKLKEQDQTAIFDSNGKFNGRIYCNDRLIATETEVIEKGSMKIILIHNLMSKEDENAELQVETVTKTKRTLMSKFKNLWTTKEKEKEKEKIEIKTMKFDVTSFLNYLRRDEMIQEGLFRLSGTFTRIKTLQDRLNSGESFEALNLTASDCHNVTSLLKQFLRNLPEPLLTFELYEAWQALGDRTSQTDVAVKIANFLVNQLPKWNKTILAELMGFLHGRLKDSETTRMNACNYGTVIGPNLLWHPQEDRQTRDSTTLGLSLQSSTLASQICTLFLQNYDEIFWNVRASDSVNDNDPVDLVMAYGKVLYDYENCYDCDDECDSCESINNIEFECNEGYSHSSTSTTSSSSSFNSSTEPLRAGQIIFITRIDDSIDGWWLAYITRRLSKFPSNYVQVIAQRADEEIIKLV